MPNSRIAERYDVVVAGGGLAGLCLALQLNALRPGARVLVVEKAEHPPPEAAHKVGESSVEVGSHYFEQVLGFSESEIGLIVVVLILLELMFALPWGWAADRFGKRRMLLLAVVLLALGDFLLAFINAQWQAYALLPLWALGDVAVFILPAALLSELIPAEHNANFMGLFLFIVAISLIVAAPISGLIFDLLDPRALPIIAGIVLLAGLPLLRGK